MNFIQIAIKCSRKDGIIQSHHFEKVIDKDNRLGKIFIKRHIFRRKFKFQLIMEFSRILKMF